MDKFIRKCNSIMWLRVSIPKSFCYIVGEVPNANRHYGIWRLIIEIYFQYIYQKQYQCQVNYSDQLHNYWFNSSQKSHFKVWSYNFNIILFNITKRSFAKSWKKFLHQEHKSQKNGSFALEIIHLSTLKIGLNCDQKKTIKQQTHITVCIFLVNNF